MGSVGFLFFDPGCRWKAWQVMCLKPFCFWALHNPPVLCKHTKRFIEEEFQHAQCTADVILFCIPEGLLHSLFHLLFCFLWVPFAVNSTINIPLSEQLVFKLYLGAVLYKSFCLPLFARTPSWTCCVVSFSGVGDLTVISWHHYRMNRVQCPCWRNTRFWNKL